MWYSKSKHLRRRLNHRHPRKVAAAVVLAIALVSLGLTPAAWAVEGISTPQTNPNSPAGPSNFASGSVQLVSPSEFLTNFSGGLQARSVVTPPAGGGPNVVFAQSSLTRTGVMPSPSIVHFGFGEANNLVDGVAAGVAACPLFMSPCARSPITTSFNAPVTNPIINVNSMGGSRVGSLTSPTAGVSGTAEFVNIKATLKGQPVPIELRMLTGNVTFAGTPQFSVRNNSEIVVNDHHTTDGCDQSPFVDPNPEGVTSRSGCGSVEIIGTFDSISMDTQMTTVALRPPLPTSPQPDARSVQDIFRFAWMARTDFGDAPASYDAPGGTLGAARAISGDLKLGAGLTVDQDAVLNGRTSINASPNADRDVDDALTTPLANALTTSSTYPLTIPLSGATQAGQLCAYLDRNIDGVFGADESVCTPFAAGATSVTLAPSLAAAAPGQTFLRLRASYDTGVTNGATSPVGASGVGEVEDYALTIEVPALPTGQDVTATGLQGKPQSAKPIFTAGNDQVPMTPATTALVPPAGSVVNADGSVTVTGQGTYTLNPDGSITFTPVLNFVGQPTAIVVSQSDEAGRTATASFLPTVDPVTPTAAPATSAAEQGSTQTGTPVFTAGDSSVPMVPGSTKLTDANLPTGSTVSADAKTATVPDEGTYQVNTDGSVTFTPQPGFVGTATPITVTQADENGTVASTTFTVTSTAVVPTAKNASKDAPQGSPVTFAPTEFATPGSPGVALVPTTVTLMAPAGSSASQDGKSVTVAGQGTWVADPNSGDVRFTPLPGFQGQPTAITATIKDANGTPSNPVTVTVKYPDVADLVKTGDQGTPVVFDPTAGSSNIDPGTVKLTTTGAPTGSTLSADGKTLTVPGQGVWTTNTITGAVTFTPAAGFQGRPGSVQFTAADANNNVALPATLTANYPDLNNQTGSANQGAPSTIDPLVGASNIDPKTVTLTATGAPTGSVVSDNGKTLTVPGEGVWVVETTTGRIKFTPDAGLQGQPTPVQFTAGDADGNSAAPATVTVSYPDLVDQNEVGNEGQPSTVDLLKGSSNIDPGTLKLTTVGVPAGSALAPDGRTLTVPGEGQWAFEPGTGMLTFTPQPGFTGQPTPVEVTGGDGDGNVARPVTVKVTLNPASKPDLTDQVGSGAQGKPVAVDVVGGATDVDPTTVKLTTDGSGVGVILSPDGKKLDVPGQGVWTVDSVTGVVTFTPGAGFQGQPTPVRVSATDNAGKPAATATVTVKYPDVADLAGTGDPGSKTSLDPMPTASNIVPDSIIFVDPGVTSGVTLSEDKKTLTIAGEGVWQADPITGVITFTPEPRFKGSPTPIQFTGVDDKRNPATPERVLLTYPDDTKPALKDQVVAGNQEEPVTFTPIAESTDVIPGSIILVGDSAPRTAILSPDAKMLTVPGEGVWTVDVVSGNVTFSPEPNYQGQPTPVHITGKDADGNSAPPASLTAKYPNVIDQVTPETGDPTIDFNPTTGSTNIDPKTVVLTGAGSPVGTTVTPDGKSLTVPGEGLWRVDKDSGKTTFTPAKGFTGLPLPIVFTAGDNAGNLASPGTLTVMAKPGRPVGVNDTVPYLPGTSVTLSPLDNDLAAPGSPLDRTSLMLLRKHNQVPSVDGKSMQVDGQGIWTVDSNGQVTFSPADGFLGIPSPVTYTAMDANGNVVVATISLTGAMLNFLPSTAPRTSVLMIDSLARTGIDGAGSAVTATMLMLAGTALALLGRRKRLL